MGGMVTREEMAPSLETISRSVGEGNFTIVAGVGMIYDVQNEPM